MPKASVVVGSATSYLTVQLTAFGSQLAAQVVDLNETAGFRHRNPSWTRLLVALAFSLVLSTELESLPKRPILAFLG